MSTNYPLGMQKTTLLHMLSYLDAKDIESFSYCDKKNHNFCKNNKTVIEFPLFLKKLPQDPNAWLYLKKVTKDKPLLQKSLITFIDTGAILKKENGYAFLQDLLLDYRQYMIIKKNLSSPSKKIVDIDCTYFHLDTIKDNKIYFISGNQRGTDQINVYDIKNNQVINLEKCYSKTSFYSHGLSNDCKFDHVHNRLYMGVYPSGNHSTTTAVSWDLSTGKIFKKFQAPFEQARGDCLMLDNNKLYVGQGNNFFGDLNGKITVFDTESGEILHSIEVMNSEIHKLKKIGNHILVFCREKYHSDSKITILEDKEFTCIKEFEIDKGWFGNKPISGNYITVNSDHANFIYDISNLPHIKEEGSIQDDTAGHLTNIKSIGKHFFLFDDHGKAARVGNFGSQKFMQTIDHPQRFLYGGYKATFNHRKLTIKNYNIKK